MDRLTHLNTVAPTPWRNGGGTTRELLAWPRSDDWQLRLSVADVASDGAFSAYPGVQRWFAVLHGAGVVLRWPPPHPSMTTVTPISAVLHFDGAAPPHAQLLAGPVQDLNLMSRSPHAGLHPVQAGQAWQAPAPAAPATHSAPGPRICGLWTAVAGQLHTGHSTHTLPAQCLFHRVADAAHPTTPWTFHPQHPTDRPGWWFHFQPAATPWETASA